MKSTRLRSIALITSFISAGVLLAGCASLAVSADDIQDRTSRALGIDKSQFTVSDRIDEGATTRYMVSTKAGKRYSCTMGGSYSMVGKSVSDALCTEFNSSGQPQNTSCNALLKAAGKCS